MENNLQSQFKLIDSDTNEDICLNEDFLLIGRDQKCDLRLEKSGISKYQAILLYKNKNFFLIDLHSSNGTYLNGRRIGSPALLSHNDIINFDQYEVRFIDSDMRSDTILRETPEVKNEFPESIPQNAKTIVPLEKTEEFPRLSFLNISKETEIITRDYVTAGRAESCDITIVEPSVSREQFVIRRMGNEFFIQNLGKSNITKVNGVPIDRQKLNGDELIKAGFVEMKFTLPSPRLQDAPTLIERGSQKIESAGESPKENSRARQESDVADKTKKASELEELGDEVPGDSKFTGHHYLKTQIKKKDHDKDAHDNNKTV